MAAATTVEIAYHCGRGAAKSKVEKCLTAEGFKQKMIKNRGIVWRLDIKNSEFIKCVEVDYGDETITVSAFLAGRDRNHRYTEEDLSGLQRSAAKQQMRKLLKEIQKQFKEE